MAQSLKIFFLIFTLTFCVGYEISLKEEKDLDPHFWKFSKERPYKYFSNTSSIPNSFLPLKVEAIPEGRGLWVLRYKDFTGVPKSFVSSNEHSTATAITYSAKAFLFDSVVVKAIIYSDAELNIVLRPMEEIPEKVRLRDYSKECSNATAATATDSNDETGSYLKWINYHLQFEPTGHITLEAKIHHHHSFLIIDEITVSYPEDMKDDSSDVKEFNGYFEPSKEGIPKTSRLLCKEEH